MVVIIASYSTNLFEDIRGRSFSVKKYFRKGLFVTDLFPYSNVGNTSDIPEAISEGASSHSVGSQDLENDDDNDNFSDMISANVSGRGTPNISGSGRDTPLSQAESEQEVVSHPQPALPETVQKKNREDVTEKFGKFEIKELDCKLIFLVLSFNNYT
jgi:hypothetical protein